ncbi:MAG: hypothetical protein BJ554DRAFT_5571, partial [Olpidium bornovanus]
AGGPRAAPPRPASPTVSCPRITPSQSPGPAATGSAAAPRVLSGGPLRAAAAGAAELTRGKSLSGEKLAPLSRCSRNRWQDNLADLFSWVVIAEPSFCDRLNAFIAGSLAGLCLRLDRNRARRTVVALYLLVRAMQYGSVWLLNWWTKSRQRRRHRKLLRDRLRAGHAADDFDDDFEVGLLHRASPGSASMTSIPSALSRDEVVARRKLELTRVTLGDRVEEFLCRWAGTGVMMMSSAQILYAFILMVHQFPSSTDGIASTAGADFFGPHIPVLSQLTEIAEGMTSKEFIHKTISPNLASLCPNGVRHDYVLCAMFHPLIARCEHAHAVGWVRSLGQSMWLYVPLNLVLYFVNGILAGLAVLIEPRKKRLELGLYCLPRALESAWKCGIEWGWLRNVAGGELIYSSLSMGVLMSLYQTGELCYMILLE